jgi:uncharacterized protein (TIGR02466 family)
MSQMKLFATDVYQVLLSDFFKKNQKDLLNEILVLMQDDHAGRDWSRTHYPKGYTSYASANQMHKVSPTFAELELCIRKHVFKYLKRLGLSVPKDQVTMTTCWVNIMEEGCTHPLHIHPQSIISGTFYLKMPSKASAIRFEDPRYGLFMHRPPQTTHVSLSAKPGDLILFESWLRHDVPLNLAKEPRVSISFNY